MTLTPWLPTIIGVLGGPAGAGIIVAWWKHRERSRAQTDGVALELVQTLRDRVDLLERWVRDLQHDLSGALAENDGLFWLLKYAPEDRRAEAVADVEARRAEKAARRESRRNSPPPTQGDKRQSAQVKLSTERVARDNA